LNNVSPIEFQLTLVATVTKFRYLESRIDYTAILLNDYMSHSWIKQAKNKGFQYAFEYGRSNSNIHNYTK